MILLNLRRIEGTEVSFFCARYLLMIRKETIETIANEHLGATELKLVEVTVSEDNDIEVIVTRESGVSIDDCVALSRHIESRLDRDKEDFSLTVGSAGI